LALFAIATATALFPSVAKAIKNDEEDRALTLLKRSFWLLLFLLGSATLAGVILAQEILWLLFERGNFTHTDTQNTALVLQMYMIGLLFWGTSKLFSLWLYAKHRQNEAAKIATFSLIANIVFSLALIYPLGAAGLALASSVAGLVQLALLAKSFGKRRLLALLNDRFAIYVPILLSFIGGVLLILKKVLHAYL
jgi:putative peptidoglycan lipid II flippase